MSNTVGTVIVERARHREVLLLDKHALQEGRGYPAMRYEEPHSSSHLPAPSWGSAQSGEPSSLTSWIPVLNIGPSKRHRDQQALP